MNISHVLTHTNPLWSVGFNNNNSDKDPYVCVFSCD